MTGVVRFVMDGEIVEIEAPSPTRTLLQYLREDVRRCGTKEGCAEGDCGACTVVLAELGADETRLNYQAVNACIVLLPTLDGKALITVESLGAAAAPHPVQRAMLDCHASQCGFCTPGFVMSLYAQYQTGKRMSRTEIDDVLSGNLCRCTGYRPIIDAAQRMYDYAPGDPAGADAQQTLTVDLLQSLQREQMLHIAHGDQHFYAPVSATELAWVLLRHEHATLLAGGTDIGLWITKQHRRLDCVVYLDRVPELSILRIRKDPAADAHGEQLVIGAAVTLSQAKATLEQHFPAFTELLTRFASVPIRNAATLGGNIANGSPIGDTMPALIAVGARLVLRRGAASRQMALEDFYLGYLQTALQAGEYVEQILIPLSQAADQVAAYKISKRFDQDISALCGAFCLRLSADGARVEHVRIAFGGLAATPKRATRCETALLGNTWDEHTLAAAAAALDQDFEPISDMRASSDYRRRCARNLLRRFFLATTGYEGESNVYTFGRGHG